MLGCLPPQRRATCISETDLPAQFCRTKTEAAEQLSVCWLLNIRTTYLCMSGMDPLRPLYLLPHCELQIKMSISPSHSGLALGQPVLSTRPDSWQRRQISIMKSLGGGGGLFVWFFCLFFFFAFPSYISGVHHFWVRFLRM